MSSLITQVRRFELKPHPNADSLSLAYPNETDWQCCCRTEDFANEVLALYIPIDTLIPTALAAEWGLPNAKDGKDFRLKTIKLRGQLSQGILVPNRGRFAEGDDVAESLGLTKYEAPERGSQGANCSIPQPEGFDKYTDIENIKNFKHSLIDGEEVVITEKLHGSNARAGWVDGVFYVGSRRMTLELESANQWTLIASKYDLEHKLRGYNGYVVYGEVYGNGVQKLAYGQSEKCFAAFDVWNGTRYLDAADFFAFCSNLCIPHVPIIYRGEYKPELLELRTGQSTLAPHVREGIVIKPAVERWDYNMGRVVVKSINEKYLLGDFDE